MKTKQRGNVLKCDFDILLDILLWLQNIITKKKQITTALLGTNGKACPFNMWH